MTSINENVVKESLFKFLKSHIPHLQIESIDDIVMSYVVSIVEEQSEEFSPDDFLEMISAYIPDIVPSELSAAKTNIWMSGLVKEIDRTKKTKSDPCHGVDLKLVIQESLNKVQVSKPNTVEEENFKQQKRVRLARLSETSDGSEGGSNDGDDFQQTVIQLLEMFPYSCSIEVSHCLQHCLGDVEKTISTIIYRHEHGQSLKPKFQNSKVVDDKEVKERILGKYGFVDKEEDSRFHRPALPKSDNKKMIRYREGKIVSTKGERFTQISKQESEELKSIAHIK